MTSIPLPLIPWQKTSILACSHYEEAHHLIQGVALDVFVLGFPSHANRLLSTLYEYAGGIHFNLHVGRTKWLYDAWEATDTTPSWISEPPPDKFFTGFDESTETGRRVKRQADEMWKEGLPGVLKGKAPDFKEDDVEYAILHLLGEIGYQDSVTVGTAVRIAVLAGDDKRARELVEKQVSGLYQFFQEKWDDPNAVEDELRSWLDARLGTQFAPPIWSFCSEGIVGRALDVKQEALDGYVDEGCKLIRQRFTEGPVRPYSDRSILELSKILEECHREDGYEKGILQPPATDEDILELEKKLAEEQTAMEKNNASNEQSEGEGHVNGDHLPNPIDLPDDYKTFLRISNGFYVDHPGAQDSIFYGISEVTGTDIDWLHDLDLELFEDVPLGEFRGFSIGPGGDEGYTVLILPSSVRLMLAKFEEMYAEASGGQKRIYEQRALDLFGGIDKLRSVEWLLMLTYHWDPSPRNYGSFKEYLEKCVVKAVDGKKEREEKINGKKRKRGFDNDGDEGEEDDDDDQGDKEDEEDEKEDDGQ